MKKSNFGFVLAETITVSIIVIGALITIYTQFVTIINSYNISFKYNTVDGMYAVNNINKFIISDGIDGLKVQLTDHSYIDITNCSSDYFIEYLYCENLFANLDVKTVLFSKENTNDLENAFNIDNPYSNNFKKFINTLKNNSTEQNYRITVEFNDGTFSSLKIIEESI